MRPFRMQLFASLLLLFSLNSCSVKSLKDAQQFHSETTTCSNLYFSEVNEDYVYKATIAAYENSFSGMLIIKKIAHRKHRIVFTTHFGTPIFDIEISATTPYKTHFIIAPLDRKLIKSLLVRDFSTLINEQQPIESSFTTATQRIHRSKSEQGYTSYFYNSNTQLLEKITSGSKRKEKIRISFQSQTDTKATQIQIVHKNKPISIELTKL